MCDAYITIFHIFHGQSPLFESAKAVVFVFGSLVSAPKQKRAGLDLPFPAGLGDSLCYLPHPAGPLEPRPGSLQCLFQWIGLRKSLQESPIFNGKIYGFL